MIDNSGAKPRVRTSVRVLALAFSILLSCGSAEVLLRLFARWDARVPRPADADTYGLPELKDSWDIMKPNVRGRFYGRLYTSNSQGFRGPEVSLEKPDGTFRIAALGDSFTNGQGVRYEESYVALLSQQLNAGRQGTRFEVINLGIGGFNLHESVRRLVDKGMKYQPDLLVYGYTVNDIEGPFYRKSRRDGPPVWTSPSRLVNLFGDQWSYFRDLFWHARGSYLWELDDNYFRNEPAWEFWKSDLVNLKRIADEKGVCVVMLIHTELAALNDLHPYKAYYDAVGEFARATGVPVVDSSEYFRSKPPRELWVNFFDHHPNPDGHRLLAQALSDGLRVLPSSCWKGHDPFSQGAATR